jgi:hypothetical protein
MLARVLIKKPDLYIAQWPCELMAYMPEHTYSVGTERSWRRLLQLEVPDCQVGDRLKVDARILITNDTGTNVEISGGLVLTPQSSGTAGMENLASVSNGQQPAFGRMISTMDGENCTPGMHHMIMQRSADFLVPEGFEGDQYVILVAYAAGGGTIANPRSIQIEPYCAMMSVERTR